MFASIGLLKALRPNPKGREDSGKAPLRLESMPVSGFTGRPLSMVKIGATSICAAPGRLYMQNHGGWADWTGPGGPRPDIARAAQRRLRPLAAIDRQGIAV